MKELEEFINKIIGKYEKSADALIYESSMNIKKSQVELDEEIESLKQKASSLLHDMRIENANKYKEMFNQGLSDEQKEELEQLGINKAPECQFAKYGFEVPEFQCEIFAERDNLLIGYAREGGTGSNIENIWHKDGSSVLTDGEFDLTPIKKPWYEDESNFPKAMVDDSLDSKRFFLSQNKDNYLHAVSCGHRHATKEEALSLYKDK